MTPPDPRLTPAGQVTPEQGPYLDLYPQGLWITSLTLCETRRQAVQTLRTDLGRGLHQCPDMHSH